MHGPSWMMTARGDGRGPDLFEVRRALALLIAPGGAHELRFLPSGRSRLARADDLDAAVKAVADLGDGQRGCYLTLNPVDPARGDQAARNSDILRRRHLLVDVDPTRPHDASATEAEKDAAGAVVASIKLDLAGRGWPDPLLIDSGNGYHLIYRIDLANDALARQWVARALKALAADHDTPGATVDVKVHNASRISKLPGTWAHKGPDTPDRPHRLCRILEAPEPWPPVPSDRLRDLAGPDPKPAPKPPAPVADPWRMRSGQGDGSAYARAALDAEVDKVATCGHERNNQLYESALKLAGLVAGGHLDEAEVRRALVEAARAAGLGGDGDPKEIGRAIDNAFAVGLASPRHPPERRPVVSVVASPGAEPAEPDDRVTIRASEVECLPVRWLWQYRIPRDFITVFAGRTGVGKSFVACDLIARLTTGRDMPDGTRTDSPGECLPVVMISEDPYEFVLTPRLLELEADLDLVSFLRWEQLLHYTLDNLGLLDRACREADRPGLVVIDPPTQFLGDGTDEHRNAEVRGILSHLVNWLKGKGCACVLITHVNKGTGKGTEAINRVIGSVAWTTTARIAHSFAPDAENPARCLFLPLKSNLGPMPRALAYSIEKTDTLATVRWRGEVDVTADQAFAAVGNSTRAVDAAEWLVEIFRQRREWPSDEFWRAAREAGVGRNAVFEARGPLRIPKPRKETDADGETRWTWFVRPDWPHLARACARERDD